MRDVLIYSAVLIVCSAQVFRQEIRRGPSMKANLIKTGRMQQFLQQQERSRLFQSPEVTHRACSRHSCEKKQEIPIQRLIAFSDSIYTGQISVGTPAQNFSVVIDTGSDLFWLASAEFCNTVACQVDLNHRYARNRFNESSSSTFNKTSSPFQISYVTGRLRGFYGRDVISLAGVQFDYQEFGLAYELNDDFLYQAIDGILGLAWPALSADNVMSPFHNILSQLEQPIFTVWLEPQLSYESSSFGGEVVYGGYNYENCEAEINYVPLSQKKFWQFAIDGFSIGSFMTFSTNFFAISDTGSSAIGVPPDALEAIVRATNATYHAKTDTYTLPCEGKYPKMVFTIGGIAYPVKARQYILHFGHNEGECILALVKIESSGYGATFLLGEPFIREYCHVHDVGRGRIGFSHSRHSA